MFDQELRCQRQNEIDKKQQTPLTLESLGVKKEDVPGFCLEAKDWLGLDINPAELRKSKILDEVNPNYTADSFQAGWYDRYVLMLKLYMATGMNALINSPLLNNPRLIKEVNDCLTQGDDKSILELSDLFNQFANNLRSLDKKFFRLPRPVKRVEKPIPFKETKILEDLYLAEDDPVRIFTSIISNYNHDIAQVAPIFTNMTDQIYLIKHSINKRPIGERKKIEKCLNSFRFTWEKGLVIDRLKLILAGYQEELIPGWSEKSSDIRQVLNFINKQVAKRFSLGYFVDGQPIEVRGSGEKGSIRVFFDTELSENQPVSAGALQRIIYNLIKNTAKAHSSVSEQNGFKPLDVEIKVKKMKGNLVIVLKDNGPGFDLNIPLQAVVKLIKEDPEYLKMISQDVSPQAAEIVKKYAYDGLPFAIYPLTLKELFNFFLMRRLSGSLVKENSSDEKTSGIGLSSVKWMLANVYGGSILVTNHPEGGAFTLINIPIEKGAADSAELIKEIR